MDDNQVINKIRRVINYIVKNGLIIPVLWYDNNNSAMGAITNIIIDPPDHVKIKFDKNVSQLPEIGIPIILRTHLFLTPITAVATQKDKNGYFRLENIQFFQVINNKRKYPRFTLKSTIEGEMMIGHSVFTVNIIDISKDGIGFVINTEKQLGGSTGKRILLQLRIKKELVKINGDIVWINRSAKSEYMGGAILYPSLREMDMMSEIMLNNVYDAEMDLLNIMANCEEENKA